MEDAQWIQRRCCWGSSFSWLKTLGYLNSLFPPRNCLFYSSHSRNQFETKPDRLPEPLALKACANSKHRSVKNKALLIFLSHFKLLKFIESKPFNSGFTRKLREFGSFMSPSR